MPTLTEKYFLQLFRIKNLFYRKEESLLTFPLNSPPDPKILFCLPKQDQNLEIIQNLIPKFINIFPSGTFYFAIDKSFASRFSNIPSGKVIPFTKDDFSSFGILKNQWTAQLPKDIFMAIDLTSENNLWSGYLCFSSGALARISLKKAYVSKFFNIILKPNQQNSFQEKTDYLLKIIQNLT